jgi:hypothetical protein
VATSTLLCFTVLLVSIITGIRRWAVVERYYSGIMPGQIELIAGGCGVGSAYGIPITTTI